MPMESTTARSYHQTQELTGVRTIQILVCSPVHSDVKAKIENTQTYLLTHALKTVPTNCYP